MPQLKEVPVVLFSRVDVKIAVVIVVLLGHGNSKTFLFVGCCSTVLGQFYTLLFILQVFI